MAAKKKSSVKKQSIKSAKTKILAEKTSLVKKNNIIKTFKSKFAKNQKKIGVILVILLLGVLLYYYKGMVIAATVNNQPISRFAVIKQLEKSQGGEVLDNLITEMIISQEAKKGNITVTDAEVNEQIDLIEKNLKDQGQDLETALSLQGLTREDLIKQIRIQKSIEKLLGDKIGVSDEEVDKFVTENKEAFSKDLSSEQIRNTAKEQVLNQKLGQEFQKWITELKQRAKINYFISY